MPRLPDIPVASWLQDQATQFQESTKGYLDSLFFEDQARQQESMIPPDYDAPGGMDQWEQAAQEKRVRELEEEQRQEQLRLEQERQQQQQTQEAQAAQAQFEQDQQDVQRTQASVGTLSSLGIPSPEEMFSNLQGWWNRPADHTSTSGVLDNAPRSEPAPSPEPTQPSSSPVNDFMHWAGDLTRPLLGDRAESPDADPSPSFSETTGPDHTSSSGVFDAISGGVRSVSEGMRSAGRQVNPVEPGAGYFDTLGRGISNIGQGLTPGGRTADEYVQGITPRKDTKVAPEAALRDILDVQTNAPKVPGAANEAINEIVARSGENFRQGAQEWSDGEIASSLFDLGMGTIDVIASPYTVAGKSIDALLPTMATGPISMGTALTNLDVIRDIRALRNAGISVTRPVVEAIRAGTAVEDLIDLGRRAGDAVGRGAYALAEEGAHQLMGMTPQARMVQPGGGGIRPDAMRADSPAIAAIKAMRSARMGEDVVVAAERELADRMGSSIAGVQEMTRGRRAAAATRTADAIREQDIRKHSDFTAHDPAVEAARQEEEMTFQALQEVERNNRHMTPEGDATPEYTQAENAWIDAQSTHAEAASAQEGVRQRLLQTLPGVETPPASKPTLRQAQKAFDATEEIYATAVTAERNASRRFGPGSEEHLAAADELEYVGAQLERRRSALDAAKGIEPTYGRGDVDPLALTPEERALNEAADARARAAPPHSGYLEDPTFTGADDVTGTNVVANPPAAAARPLDQLQKDLAVARRRHADAIQQERDVIRRFGPGSPEYDRITFEQQEALNEIHRIRASMDERSANEAGIATPVTTSADPNAPGYRIPRGVPTPPAIAPETAAPTANTVQEGVQILTGAGKNMGRAIREADLRMAEGRMRSLRKRKGFEGPEFDEQMAATPLGQQIQRYREELAARAAQEAAAAPTTAPSAATTATPARPSVPRGTLEIGQEVVTAEGKSGVISSIGQMREGGTTLSRVTVRHEDGTISRVLANTVTPTGADPLRDMAELVRHPTLEESSVPGVMKGARIIPDPINPTGPPRVGSGTATPEGVESVRRDAEVIYEMLERSRGRAGNRAVTPDDVKRVMNWFQTWIKTPFTDRKAKLSAGERYLQSLRGGEPLSPEEQAWVLSRLYAGREDVSLARSERMLQDPLRKVGKKFMPDLERAMIQLNNIGVDWLTRWKEEQRVLGKIPEVQARQKPSADDVRREGESILEVNRAKANMRGIEKEWIAAEKENKELLDLMEKAGEGPTQMTKPRRRKNKVTGKMETIDTPHTMESDEFMRLQDRLEKSNIRRETAKARYADNRKIIEDSVAKKMVKAGSQEKLRARERAEQIGEARQYPGGATPQKVDDVLQELVDRLGPKKAMDVADGLDAVYKYRDFSRDRIHQSGLWDDETLSWFKDANPYYIPTNILDKMDEKVLEGLPTGARTFSSRDDLIKHLTPEGTTADQMTPIRAVLGMGAQAEAAAQRNVVMRRVAGWADEPGMENLVQKVKADVTAPPGWKKMSAMIDGKAQNLLVEEGMAKSLELATPGWTGIFGAAVRGASNLLGKSATSLRPSFITANAVNDAILTLFRYSTEGGLKDFANPISRTRDIGQLIRGYHTSMGAANPAAQAGAGALFGGQATSMGLAAQGDYPWNDPGGAPGYWSKVGAGATAGAGIGLARRLAPVDRAMIQRFRESGASMGMNSRFTSPDDIARQLAGEHVWVRTLRKDGDRIDLLKSRAGQVADVLSLVWGRPLAEIGKIVENAPRYSAFYRGEAKTASAVEEAIQALNKSGDMSPEVVNEMRQSWNAAAVPEIANYARRVTVDFDAGGSFVKTLNQISPFLNPSTQALVEYGDMAKKNPGGVAAATAAVVAATIYTEIHNRSTSAEDNKNVSDYTKNTGLYILSDKDPEGEGKRGLVYIPARGGVGAAIPLVRAMMGAVFGDDPRTWKKLAIDTGLATINQMSPVNADIGGIVDAFTPPVLSLINQAVSNYDAFRGQPIISRSMESMPKSEQYDDRTSQTARQLARSGLPLTGSPLMTDWFIKGLTPGPGEAFLSASDNAIKAFGPKVGLDVLPDVTRNVPKGIRDVPLTGAVSGRFFRTVGSAEQGRAYDIADEIVDRESVPLVQELQSSSMYQRATPDRQKQMLRSLESALRDKANLQAGVEVKPKDVGQPTRWNDVDSGSALEREIIRAIGANAADRSSEQKELVRRYQGRETREYREWRQDQTSESERIKSLVR